MVGLGFGRPKCTSIVGAAGGCSSAGRSLGVFCGACAYNWVWAGRVEYGGLVCVGGWRCDGGGNG